MRRWGCGWFGVVTLALWSCSGGSHEGSDVAADQGTSATDSRHPTDSGNEDMELTVETVPFDWCAPDSPPDALCHASKRDPDSENIALALEIARAQIARKPPQELNWNWEEAVLLVGMAELYDVTGAVDILQYYQAWMDHHIAKGYTIGTSDTCAPAGVAVALYRQTGDAKYRTVVETALEYLYHVALRTEEGGISHLGTVPLKTLWVDSLFMFGTVLFGWGEAVGDAAALDEYGTQFELFTQLLQDESGFYVHAYDWIMKQTPGVYWGRGNGWVAASGAMYHRILSNRGENRPAVEQALVRLLESAVAAQDAETGLWWTILSRPNEIYLETSATALFAFGMARAWRYGLMQDPTILPTIEAAMAGVKSKIVVGEDGIPVVTDISGPTSADKFDEYARVPLENDLPYGVGAVILSLVETSGLPASDEDGK